MLPGFAPAAEVLFFREKDPKPFLPGCSPSGSLTAAPNHMAVELAPLKQSSPKSWIRSSGSAAPKGKHKKECLNSGKT